MEYVQPVGAAADAPYLDANPSGGIEGSPVPAAAIEHPMRELVALITDAGITPSDADLDQVASAVRTLMQKQSSCVSNASGTADAITGGYAPAITALVNGMTLYVRAGSANATATPTFTPASGTIVAKTIVKGAGAELAAGDIAGGGHWIELQYDVTLDKWVLLNPATGVSVTKRVQIQTITASVAANALTVGLNPTSLDFRSNSLTSGTVNTRTVAAALSLTAPSGATLGTVSGQSARLALLAIDNAGAVELAITNLAGGTNLDETTLISTTAISAAATSASVIYSTAARTNVPFRVVGFIDITESAAGTWSTAPTVVQGQGGQALAAISSLGYGQTEQDVSASRAIGTTYYNTTGKPITCIVTISTNGSSSTGSLVLGSVTLTNVVGNSTGNTVRWPITFVVRPGQSYALTGFSGASVSQWVEIR